MADRWEYKYVRDLPSEDELNQLGEQEWELTGTVVTTSPQMTDAAGRAMGSGMISHVTLNFKRRKP